MTEVEEEKKAKTIVISQTSELTAQSLLRRMGVASTENMVYKEKIEKEFLPFFWPKNLTENQATPAALAHLKTELLKFSVRLGGDGAYFLFDTHTKNSLLNIESSRIGKISGGTDAVIAPFGTAADSVTNCACVIFELKKNLASVITTEDDGTDVVTAKISSIDLNEAENELDTSASRMPPSDYPQLVVEALAASLISNQPVLSILTDLHSNSSVAIKFIYDRSSKSFFVERYLNLTFQMAHFVAAFLQANCRPIVKYITQEDFATPEPVQEVVQRIKKQCLFNETSLAWEHFCDHFPDTAVGSIDRAEVVCDLFQSHGLRSNYAHMFA